MALPIRDFGCFFAFDVATLEARLKLVGQEACGVGKSLNVFNGLIQLNAS